MLPRPSRSRSISLDGSTIKAQIIDPLEHMKINPGSWKPRKDIELKSGGFGDVTVVERGKNKLAMKQLNFPKGQINVDRFAKRFARELTVWEKLDHPNLIKLSGFYLSSDLTIAQFFCPYYPNGNLRQYLATHSLDYPTKCRLAEDTAIALEYLHKRDIVHGDLKDLNVLLNDRLRAVLCDYGLAKRISLDGLPSGLTTSGNPITVKYASPELLSGERSSRASDVWAWACLHMKILTGKDPYLEVPITAVHKRVLVDKEIPANIDSLALCPIFRTMLSQSWTWEPAGRPTMVQCVNMVKAHRSQVQFDRSSSLPRSDGSSIYSNFPASNLSASSRMQSTSTASQGSFTSVASSAQTSLDREKGEAKFIMHIRDFAYDTNDPRHKEEREVNLSLALKPSSPLGAPMERVTPSGSLLATKESPITKSSAKPAKPKERGLFSRLFSLMKERRESPNVLLQGPVYEEPMDISDERDPFSPGVYRAMYSFEPERPAEMKIDVDQRVWCLRKEGGDGWLLAVRDGYPDKIIYALVPEGYLTFETPFKGDEYSLALHGPLLHWSKMKRQSSSSDGDGLISLNERSI